MKTTRVAPGRYWLHFKGRYVEVLYSEQCKGWIAAAGWDRYLLTDPVPTKRAAVREAWFMLNSRDS